MLEVIIGLIVVIAFSAIILLFCGDGDYEAAAAWILFACLLAIAGMWASWCRSEKSMWLQAVQAGAAQSWVDSEGKPQYKWVEEQ